MSAKLLWCPQAVMGDEDRLQRAIVALEEEAALLRAKPRRSLALQERIDGLEATIAEFYALLGERHISAIEWGTSSRVDLAGLAARVSALAEVEFLLWLSCRTEREVLGHAGLERGVLHHYLSRTLNIPLSAVIPEREYVLLDDGRRTLRVELPCWAVAVNELTSRGICGRAGVRVTARGLRWLLRLPRAGALSEVRGDA